MGKTKKVPYKYESPYKLCGGARQATGVSFKRREYDVLGKRDGGIMRAMRTKITYL
jgi:hypothetical protein